MKGLTRRQYECKQFIVGFIARHGYSPTFRQIAAELGFNSLGTLHKIVSILREKGHLAPNGGTVAEMSDDYKRGWQDGYDAALKKTRSLAA